MPLSTQVREDQAETRAEANRREQEAKISAIVEKLRSRSVQHGKLVITLRHYNIQQAEVLISELFAI